LDPDDWKPMPTVGPGVREIRIHVEGAHRVFCAAARADAKRWFKALRRRELTPSARSRRDRSAGANYVADT
jgi:hypothetical protein